MKFKGLIWFYQLLELPFGPPLGWANPAFFRGWGKLGKCKKEKKKIKSAASRNDGTILYGNETAVSRGGGIRCERSSKGPAVIECHSHGPMLLATVLTRSLIASWDISLCWVTAMLPGLLMSAQSLSITQTSSSPSGVSSAALCLTKPGWPRRPPPNANWRRWDR